VLGGYTLAEDQDVFEVDSLFLILIFTGAILTWYLGPFWDTFQGLAFKSSLMGLFLALGLVIMLVVQVFTEGGFDFNKGVNLRAVGVGIMGAIPLVLIQVFVFAFVPPDQRALSVVPLSSAGTAGLQPNWALGLSFVNVAAIDESTALQGGAYTLLVRIVSNYEDDHDWAEILIAAGTIAALSFLIHLARYGDTGSSLAVAVGFFYLCLEYEFTDTLTSPIISHQGLNSFSGLLFGYSVTVM